MTTDQINTFQATSGVTPHTLSYTVRMGVGGALIVWALFILLSLMSHLKEDKRKVSPGNVATQLLRMGLIVMLGLIIIS